MALDSPKQKSAEQRAKELEAARDSSLTPEEITGLERSREAYEKVTQDTRPQTADRRIIFEKHLRKGLAAKGVEIAQRDLDRILDLPTDKFLSGPSFSNRIILETIKGYLTRSDSGNLYYSKHRSDETPRTLTDEERREFVERFKFDSEEMESVVRIAHEKTETELSRKQANKFVDGL